MADTGANPWSLLGTLAAVLVSIVGLSVADAYLARTERTENSLEGKRLEAAGLALMKQDRPADAAEQFKGALSIERDNDAYKLELGEAQLAAGELTDAESTLEELLRRNSTSGPANLALARVLMKEGRAADAVSAYHRAIYGHWDQDPAQHEMNARFELVNFLAAQGSKSDLLSELLPLIDVAPENPVIRGRLGWLFLDAGSAPRAAEIFGDILRHYPRNADAYDGLGEAEFASGNYQTARGDFQSAANLRRPADPQVLARLKLCNEVLALDPMRRGLSPQEQHMRSVKMLDLASESVKRCESPLTPLSQEMVDEAEKAMKHRVIAAEMSKAVESNMNLAEELWNIREQRCGQIPAREDEALRLVLAKIAQ